MTRSSWRGGGDKLDAAEFHDRKLSYLGRKSITRYGCYGCHDIPNFEKARPIGTGLQDWGKKDRSRLAFEHIHEYLHHNGQAGLGVKVDSIDAVNAKRLNLKDTQGVRVAKVAKGGKGLLKFDDVLLALDGVPIKGVSDYEDALERTVVGSPVSVTVWRDRKPLAVTMTGSAKGLRSRQTVTETGDPTIVLSSASS